MMNGEKLDFEKLKVAADCLRVLANPNRLHIVQWLSFDKEYTVTELAEHCDLTQSAVSNHLRLMQRCGFLSSERVGQAVYYSIAKPQVRSLLSRLLERFGS